MVYRKDFHRKVDTSGFKTCCIAGSDILVADMKWVVNYISDHIKELSGDYIMVTASNEIVMACEDKHFFRCQNGGLMSIPDGAPLVTYGRLHGYKDMCRITGPDLMLEIFKISAEKGFRHYFYGNRQEVLDIIRKRLNRDYPGLQIAGMHPSFYRDLTPEEDRIIIEEINASHPDFVWFCLGSPKGCYFAADHQGKIDALMISVGAGFDYFAHRLRRAPVWMQRMNLEWFYRILQEPKRMMRRYFYVIPRFFWHAYVLKK
jgi:N-acetylglucosaminyldiphosphoundecaprenol N-acetyl-beta-D-mannosaminyltransferase